jgi:phosphoglycerol transferase
MLVIAVAGLSGSLYSRNFRQLGLAALMLAVVLTGALIDRSPYMFYRLQAGDNIEQPQRRAYESEIYGLKIVQLLLPRPSHRSESLAAINKKYREFPLVNENSSAALGMVAAAGLLASLFILLFSVPLKVQDKRLVYLSVLIGALLLVATVGGFSSLFAMLLTPMIRGWNRASIFIGFCSLAVFFVLLQSALTRYRFASNRLIVWGLAAVLIVIGMWDQTTPPCSACRDKVRGAFLNDREFVRQIEAQLGDDGAVYQLPYIAFPESPNKYKMTDYALFKGYLHSDKLNWSYGSYRGREGDLFFRALSKEPLGVQLKLLRRLGYGGIYIDRRGYRDRAVALESELIWLVGEPVAISQDENLAYFKIPPDVNDPKIQLEGLTNSEIMKKVGYIADRRGGKLIQNGTD